jgi:nitrate reductase NapD
MPCAWNIATDRPEEDKTMSISGLVIHVRPEKVEAVQNELLGIDGMDVHAATEDGRVVATLDRPTDSEAADTLYQIRDIEGVINTALVYNYFDDEDVEADQEEEAHEALKA